MIVRNKHSAAPSTTVWIVATVIILFIMVIYYGFVSATYLRDSAFGFLSISSQADAGIADSKLALTKGLISFLESPVSSEAGSETIYDIALKAGEDDGRDSERKDIFNAKALEFLEEEFPRSAYSSYLVIMKSEELSDYSEGYRLSRFIHGYSLKNADSIADALKLEESADDATNSVQTAIPIPRDKLIYLFVMKK